MIKKIKKIFGIIYITKALKVEKNIESINEGIVKYISDLKIKRKLLSK